MSRLAGGMLGVVLFLSACPLPEDQFVLSGRAVDNRGDPRPNIEVRLLRNQLPSETRCDALEPLDSTLTDDDGRYAFSLIRQQITGGVSARRFFRVEVDAEERVISQSFWFPDADLDLGPLEIAVPRDAWRVTESILDGHVAWRSEGVTWPVFDRPQQVRTSWGLREWRTVPIDSLGRYDIVPVDWAAEKRVLDVDDGVQTISQGRGAECPSVEVTPCPLTDGRYLPFEFPENTRTIVLNFKRETNVSPLVFHGLVLARLAVRLRLEFNFVLDFDNWNRFGESTLDVKLQERSGERCADPGAFMSIKTVSQIKPVLLRIAFLDEAGDLVPIVSLAEITTP